jgi:hypothetical protein
MKGLVSFAISRQVLRNFVSMTPRLGVRIPLDYSIYFQSLFLNEHIGDIFRLQIGLKRNVFAFSRFCENFLTKIDENSGNFCENFRENAKSVTFTTYFNFLRTFLSIILF